MESTVLPLWNPYQQVVLVYLAGHDRVAAVWYKPCAVIWMLAAKAQGI
jgi:hypothetical protein